VADVEFSDQAESPRCCDVELATGTADRALRYRISDAMVDVFGQ
jgi:hypothetical protein